MEGLLHWLPSDIFENIFPLLSSFTVNALYATGDRRVHRILEKSCYEYRESWATMVRPPLWPASTLSCLSSLRSLDIRIPDDCQHVPISGIRLDVLPRSLTTLG